MIKIAKAREAGVFQDIQGIAIGEAQKTKQQGLELIGRGIQSAAGTFGAPTAGAPTTTAGLSRTELDKLLAERPFEEISLRSGGTRRL